MPQERNPWQRDAKQDGRDYRCEVVDGDLAGKVRSMSATVRVPSGPLAFGGWKGRVEFNGDVIRVVGDDPANTLDIDAGQVKRCSFNSNNGLWAFRMKDGKKVYLQISGTILSADRTDAGRAANVAVGALLAKHRVRGIAV